MNKQKITILYERLSRDDELQGPSNSILNQKLQLEEYAKANGLTPYIHIDDDGYSGTNWNRPGWQKLIAMVDADEVACIVMKDSSRMGRDYLRMGLYREMFHEKSIRLIAINDNVDTQKGEDDFTPFREIMAEWYARDTSKKIKSVFAAKGKSGKPTSSTPPYGYMKDPNDKYKWILDEPAAEVVKRIFQMAIDGLGVHTICGILHNEQIERPSYYLGTRGRGRHKNDYSEEHKFAWGSATIINILKKLEYTGCVVNLKSESASFKSKKKKHRPKKDWLIFPNSHEAIISQETFETVQKLRETPRRIDTLGEANPLTGLLFCADCGEKLYNHRKARPEKPHHNKLQNNYHCKTFKLSNSKFDTKCTPHHISTESVRNIILDVLKRTSGYVKNHEQDFLAKLQETFTIKQSETEKSSKQQLAKNEKRISELNRIFHSLYEDKALDKITEERFSEMTANYETELEEIKAQNEKLQTELNQFHTQQMNMDSFMALIRKHTHFEELTNAMLNEFVDKVIVYECVWSEGRHPENNRPMGSRSQQVDVYLKHIGKFDVPDTRTPEEIEAERIAEEKLEAKRAYSRNKTREHLKRKMAKQYSEAIPTPTPAPERKQMPKQKSA